MIIVEVIRVIEYENTFCWEWKNRTIL